MTTVVTTERPTRRPSSRRVALVLLVVLVGAAALAVVGFPTRAWWDQRHQLERTTAELERLQQDNERLGARITALQTDDAEIERVAREQLGMVKPGERAYAILPPPPPDRLPSGWPYDTVRRMVTRR